MINAYYKPERLSFSFLNDICDKDKFKIRLEYFYVRTTLYSFVNKKNDLVRIMQCSYIKLSINYNL